MGGKMKKRIIYFCLILFLVVFISGCKKEEKIEVITDAVKFKEEYESLNGKKNARDIEYRELVINENNPFIYSDAKEIIKKMDNEESFYIYFGSNKCPWCRSVIETLIKVSNDNKIDKIYYVDIWDKDGKEILRDKYEYNEDNKLIKTYEGTEEYFILLERFNDYLEDYTIVNPKTNKKKKLEEKRIYAPSFIYIEKGKIKKMETGLSKSLESSTTELTDIIKEEQKEIFTSLFKKD